MDAQNKEPGKDESIDAALQTPGNTDSDINSQPVTAAPIADPDVQAETEPTRHIGQDLRLARVNAGLTHSEISETLKIQSVFLNAIEQLDTAALPSIGYVLGYVRAYAQHLGMDGLAAVERYKVDSKVPENLGRRSTPHFVPKRQIRLPRGFFAATTIMSCAAVLAFWYGSQTDAQSNALNPATNLNAPGNAPVVSPIDPELMTFKATAPTWVQIKDQFGNSIISRILVSGESWQTGIYANVTLSARDSGALELYVGGELMGRLGRKGIPMTDVPMPAVPRDTAVTPPETLAALSGEPEPTETTTTPSPQ